MTDVLVTSINIIHRELEKLERIVKVKQTPLPIIQRHAGHVKQVIRARLENGTVQPHEVTPDTIMHQGGLLESEALEVYDYLKELELI
ncbi:unnamed protein product [marine sediment metagenome]|uniref:Uncharacterized protein n=1 Tax=marine sediment metagenome TaxID=412755 RepID=X1C796_9ZZZZ